MCDRPRAAYGKTSHVSLAIRQKDSDRLCIISLVLGICTLSQPEGHRGVNGTLKKG